MTGPAEAAVQRRAAGRAWLAELRAGTAGAAAALPLALTLGVLAFGPAGGAAAALGVPAAATTLVLGGLAFGLLSRAALPAAGPSSATALIVAGFVVRIAADPGVDLGSGAGRAALLAAVGALVAAGGLLLLLLGALRLGSPVRLVPRPVLAGFMNGVAVLIVVAQLPALTGIAAGSLAWGDWAALRDFEPVALAAGLATAALTIGVARRFPRAPAALVGLVVGSLLAIGATAWGPPLARVGSVPLAGSSALALLSAPGAGFGALLWRHGADFSLSALLLALVGGLESLLGLQALESLHGGRSDADRDLAALGAANVVSGLCGGLPVVFLRVGAVAVHRGGGSSRRATMAASVILGLAFALAAPLLAAVPQAVLAGSMLALAIALADGWTQRLLARWWAGDRSADLRQSLAVAAVVCALTLVFGFVAGVGAGVLLSMLVFARSMNRLLLRARSTAVAMPSRRLYPPRLEALLADERRRIELIELEGALFFGSSERLVAAALDGPAERAFLVLDLRRVTTIDPSGALGLVELQRRLAERGVALLLAGAAPDSRHGRTLQALGGGAAGSGSGGAAGALGEAVGHADADRATEAAEAALLARRGERGIGDAVPLARCALFAGATAAQWRRLGPLLRERRLGAGETLFVEGDAGDALFVLTDGSISIVGAIAHGGGLRHRYLSFSSGMAFGETALLDGGGRTADAVADVASTVHALDAAAFAELEATAPELAALLYRNLALHLSQRLRTAAASWQRSMG